MIDHFTAGTGYGLATLSIFTRGEKSYELSNHLGNILTTITDKKIAVPSTSNSSLIDHFTADIATAQDYYPFGMLMPGRTYPGGTISYRYGFNGKENDNEVKGVGNEIDYGMRYYDPRAGRFMSTDPLTGYFAWYTPYQFAGNKPTWKIDLDGEEESTLDLSNEGDAGAYLTITSSWNLRNAFTNTAIRLIPGLEASATRSMLKNAGITDEKQQNLLMEYVTVRYETFTKLISGFPDFGNATYDVSRRPILTPKNTAAKELLAASLDLLTVAGSLPIKGAPFILAEESRALSNAAIGDIVRGLEINARVEEIAGSFHDISGTGRLIKQFEAESGAILEKSTGVKLRELKKGEEGDYAIESGSINGINATGKTVDQLGPPASSIGKYKMSQIFNSIKGHFLKEGVDYLLFDARNLSASEKAAVTEYLHKNYSNQLNKVITIGL